MNALPFLIKCCQSCNFKDFEWGNEVNLHSATKKPEVKQNKKIASDIQDSSKENEEVLKLNNSSVISENVSKQISNKFSSSIEKKPEEENKVLILSKENKAENSKKISNIMKKDSNRLQNSNVEEDKEEIKNNKSKKTSDIKTNPTQGKVKNIIESPQHIEPADITKTKKLILTILEGTHLPSKAQITINAGGYVESKRKEKDGYTYFGNIEDYNASSKNDFISNAEKSGFGKRHFVIKYIRGKRLFYKRCIRW